MLHRRKSKVLAIIPVRANSKGIPNKNLLDIGGITILERTILLAKKCPLIDNIIVSTDSEKMYAIAKSLNVHSKQVRPATLATDTASTLSVIEHELKTNDIHDTEVLLLQVTSPLRNSTHLKEFLELYDSSPQAQSAVSLTHHSSPHPDKIQAISENGFVKSYLGKESMVARQLLPKVYALNGAFYIRNDQDLIKHKSFFSDQTLPYIMKTEESINLDSPLDKEFLEFLIEKNKVQIEDLRS